MAMSCFLNRSLLIISSALLFACQTENTQSETNFSAEAKQNTLLSGIANRGGATFCYELRDVTGKDADVLYEKFKTASEGAIRKWVSALEGQKGWKFRASDLSFSHMRKSSCQVDGNTVSITVYLNPENYVKSCSMYYKKNGFKSSDGGCHSFALPWKRVVWVKLPDTSATMISSALTHELGHLLGIGDSYNLGPNQPPGVMGTYGVASLSSDDIAGIRSVWEATFNRLPVPRCPPGYKVHSIDASENFVACTK